MKYETIAFEKKDNIGILSLNRPEVRNAMNTSMLLELIDLLGKIEEDKDVRVLIVNGKGKSFCAGADISEMRENTPDAQGKMNDKFIKVFNWLERLRKPVIGSVHGYALAGGTELTLSCDMIIASEDAKFGMTEITIGVFPGAGALIRALRWMGNARAKQLAMTGDHISAQEALNFGLVNKVVERGKLEEEAMAMAKKLARWSPVALGSMKAAMNTGGEMDQDKGIAYALREFLLLFTTHDQKEGMRAFLEKREPNFIGE